MNNPQDYDPCESLRDRIKELEAQLQRAGEDVTGLRKTILKNKEELKTEKEDHIICANNCAEFAYQNQKNKDTLTKIRELVIKYENIKENNIEELKNLFKNHKESDGDLILPPKKNEFNELVKELKEILGEKP